MYYLGIYGEVTKTKYVLINENLEVVTEIQRGTTHPHHISMESLELELLMAVNEVIDTAKIKREDLKFIFITIQAYGESVKDTNGINKAVKEAIGEFEYKIDNDSLAGWAAGTLCKEGINVVAGSGSIVFGMNKNGESGRAGGWGPIIGDDGSAQWIGIKLINEYTKQKDGRKPVTKLIEIIENEREINGYYGIVELIFNKYNLSITEFSKFCAIGKIAADEGCLASKQIFEDASYQLFLLIRALKEKLKMEEEFILSYTGEAFEAGEYILKPLSKILKANNIKCIIKEPTISPSKGAALLAYKFAGNEISDDMSLTNK